MDNTKITYDMILRGLQIGAIRITDEGRVLGAKPGGCVVCAIGDSWFYAFGTTGEETPLDEFIASIPQEEIAKEIFAVLDGDGGFETELPDEYQYYYFYLMEAAKLEEALQSSCRRKVF